MKTSRRRRIPFLSSGLILFALLLGSPNLRALEVPTLRGRVNDLAGLLSAGRVRDLEERMKRFEDETGHQIAVLTIPSLEGENLEAFSIKVAETWKIGQKGFDNGVILLIARNDRKLRIEVGYGLEGVLPDALASRIIREVIVPHFRSNDYPGGIEAGLDAIMKATRGEALPAPARTRAQPRSTPVREPAPGAILFLLSVLALFVGAGVEERFGSDTRSELQTIFLGAAFGGATSAALGIFALATGFGLHMWILTVFVGSIMGAIGSRKVYLGQWSVGGGNGYSGGGSFGGGGDGGGFSGGGGESGGGGSSGSW